MTVKLSPLFNDAQLDSSGNPLTGGKVYTYAAGSSTPQTTYQDSAGATPHANPIILNSRGEPPAAIWLTSPLTYKFELQTAAGVTIRTIDNIAGVNDTSVSLDQWAASGLTPTYISATSFSLAGDQTTAFHLGRRLKTTNSGGTIYSTISGSTFGAVTTVTVVNDSGTLDAGLSAVSYGLISAANTSDPSLGAEYVCQGRLTLTSGTPVTTADVTAAETVYFTPFRGNKIDLYDSTMGWVRVPFSELSIDVPDATQMNDVFLYLSSGVLTADVVAWTNDTTRATALSTQNGVLVKSGATGRRYVGTFYGTTAGNGQTEDSFAKRNVWNYYNRVVRPMRNVAEGTNSWAYSLATWRQANANAANQLEYVQGVSEDPIFADVYGAASNSGGQIEASTGIGLDSTSADSSTRRTGGVAGNTTHQVVNASYRGYPGVGRHTLVWLERVEATGTTTWYGDNGGVYKQTGISGELPG